MTTGLIVQYVITAALLVSAVVTLWRKWRPSKSPGCDSGCGACSSGCNTPAERIPVKQE